MLTSCQREAVAEQGGHEQRAATARAVADAVGDVADVGSDVMRRRRRRNNCGANGFASGALAFS